MFLVDIHAEQGGHGIQDRVEGTQYRPHNDGRKKAYQPDRQHFFDQLWINGVLLIKIGILKIIVTNYPWQYNDQGDQDLEKSRYQQSLLGLLQVFRSQGPLNDRLV